MRNPRHVIWRFGRNGSCRSGHFMLSHLRILPGSYPWRKRMRRILYLDDIKACSGWCCKPASPTTARVAEVADANGNFLARLFGDVSEIFLLYQEERKFGGFGWLPKKRKGKKKGGGAEGMHSQPPNHPTTVLMKWKVLYQCNNKGSLESP